MPELSWASMDPLNVHSLTVASKPARKLEGCAVAYVRPQAAFEKALSVLEDSLTEHASRHARLSVCGPQGSGKSRLGYELYLELKRRGTALGLARVAFASCLFSAAKETQEIQSVADLVRHVVRNCATAPDTKSSMRCSQPEGITLKDVARHLTGWADGTRTALVLQLDDCHAQPDVVTAIQRAVTEANGADDGCLVLPICTGTPGNTWARPGVPKAASSNGIVYLGYLEEANGATDHATTWSVVRNAVHAACESGPLPLSLNAAPEPLVAVVKSLCGWPLGAVQLGGQLAALEVVQKAGKQGSQLEKEAWGMDADAWLQCEVGMDSVLRRLYAARMRWLSDALPSSGLFKLTVLVLGSLPVSGCVMGDA